MGALIVW